MNEPPPTPPRLRKWRGLHIDTRLRRLVFNLALAGAVVLAIYLWQPQWFSISQTISSMAHGGAKGTPTPPPTPTPTPKPTRVTYPYLGESWTVDSVQFTPLNVRYTYGSGGNHATVGDIYAVVMLRITNHQGGDYAVIPAPNCAVLLCKFYIRDKEGRKYPPVNYDPLLTKLQTVILPAGSYVDGSYTFEVPAADARANALQLLYYHDPLTDANAVVRWNLAPRPLSATPTPAPTAHK